MHARAGSVEPSKYSRPCSAESDSTVRAICSLIHQFTSLAIGGSRDNSERFAAPRPPPKPRPDRPPANPSPPDRTFAAPRVCAMRVSLPMKSRRPNRSPPSLPDCESVRRSPNRPAGTSSPDTSATSKPCANSARSRYCAASGLFSTSTSAGSCPCRWYFSSADTGVCPIRFAGSTAREAPRE